MEGRKEGQEGRTGQEGQERQEERKGRAGGRTARKDRKEGRTGGRKTTMKKPMQVMTTTMAMVTVVAMGENASDSGEEDEGGRQ
jgi:hypothetical protein